MRNWQRPFWTSSTTVFVERNSHLHVYSAHLHMDEATPHLHIDFIPFTTGSKRGLSTRVVS
ncbi:MAG: plasmid recombination protein [Acutalibacteraceae bacterium]